ncbi:MAG: ATP synthase F1 subunit epsilon [Actinomycetota bacterium]|nr:ATP synthase F1 subunit epsilon [Actinomycetota bacterium]
MAQGEHPGNLDVVVVSPARPIFEGVADWVTAPAWNRVGRSGGQGRWRYGAAEPERLAVGQLGIWPRHAPIVAALGSGVLRIGQEGGKVDRFAVRGGFLKVGDNKVTILVDSAVAEADATKAEAQRDLDETLEALRHPKSDEEFAELLDRRAWSQSRLKLAGS